MMMIAPAGLTQSHFRAIFCSANKEFNWRTPKLFNKRTDANLVRVPSSKSEYKDWPWGGERKTHFQSVCSPLTENRRLPTKTLNNIFNDILQVTILSAEWIRMPAVPSSWLDCSPWCPIYVSRFFFFYLLIIFFSLSFGGGGGGGGVLNRNLGRGVRPTQRNPDPVQDTNDVNFATLSKRKCCNFLPCSRLDQAGGIKNTKNGT